MSWHIALAWIVSAVPIALTALSVVRSPKWWIRIWDYPRLQVAVALALVAAIQLASLPASGWSVGLLGTTLACLAWQLSRIYPYTRVSRKQVPWAGQHSLKNCVSILIANVLRDNRRAADFLRLVAQVDPDIVLAVETDHWWDQQFAPLCERYPHAVRHPLENTYGMHLFSRLSLADVRLQDRVTADIPSIFARLRLRSGQWVNLHCLHPEPPQVGNDVEERDAELLLVAREVASDKHPTIVCGDLNDVAWSHTTSLFQRISALLDPRVGRGLYPTFHAEYRLARWPLDHVFHDASFVLQRLQVLGYFGSDHFPVYVQLVHQPGVVPDGDVPSADIKDQQEAAERIVEGRQAARQDGRQPS